MHSWWFSDGRLAIKPKVDFCSINKPYIYDNEFFVMRGVWVDGDACLSLLLIVIPRTHFSSVRP